MHTPIEDHPPKRPPNATLREESHARWPLAILSPVSRGGFRVLRCCAFARAEAQRQAEARAEEPHEPQRFIREKVFQRARNRRTFSSDSSNGPLIMSSALSASSTMLPSRRRACFKRGRIACVFVVGRDCCRIIRTTTLNRRIRRGAYRPCSKTSPNAFKAYFPVCAARAA